MTDADRERAQALVASGKSGALGTLARAGGHPFTSLVAYALVGAEPVFLLSELAEHTRNLRADARASLLVVEDGELVSGRVTLVGRCLEADRAAVEADYLARHPDAASYLALGDFRFWRLELESARFVAGFGRMGWIAPAEWASACSPR
jgi:putative heme iron utilization protein